MSITANQMRAPLLKPTLHAEEKVCFDALKSCFLYPKYSSNQSETLILKNDSEFPAAW